MPRPLPTVTAFTPLDHTPVIADFRAVPEDISQAYALVVPE